MAAPNAERTKDRYICRVYRRIIVRPPHLACIAFYQRHSANVEKWLYYQHSTSRLQRPESPQPGPKLRPLSGCSLDVSISFEIRLLLWEILTSDHSVAEIASGIICGCLPVVPQFFRIFVPKIASKITAIRQSKSSSQGSRKYGSSLRNGRAALWHDPHDPRLLQASYLELGQRDKISGPSTTISGGKQDRSSDVQRGGKYPWDESSQVSEVDEEAAGNKILKTVRVERSSFWKRTGLLLRGGNMY